MENNVKAFFDMERETKNTVRFNEVVRPMATPAIGILYVQKSTLKEIGYKEGQQLELTISKREAV